MEEFAKSYLAPYLILQTQNTHPENLWQLPWVHCLVTWADGEVPLNILTWPSLTFLAAPQTFVYQRLFIKHTLLIIKAIISSISELGNILWREKTERQRVGWGLHSRVACSNVVKCRNDGTETWSGVGLFWIVYIIICRIARGARKPFTFTKRITKVGFMQKSPI